MSDEKSQQQTSTESTVAGAAKTGKAISNIAKGAAAGGAHGAAIEAGKSSAKWLIPLIAAVLLPLILVAMLPSIIFGSLSHPIHHSCRQTSARRYQRGTDAQHRE